MNKPNEAVWCKLTLAIARTCLLFSVLSAVVGSVLNTAMPAWVVSLLSTACLASFSFGLVFYSTVFLAQASLVLRAIVLGGSGLLLACYPLVRFEGFKSICVVIGLILLAVGIALAGSLILSSSVLINDSQQTRSKL